MSDLLFGHDKTVAEWAESQFKLKFAPYQYAIGILGNDGVLKGAALFHRQAGFDVEMSFFGPRSMRKDLFKKIVSFCFDCLKVNRVTIRVPRRNRNLTRMLAKRHGRLGFHYEGVQPGFFGRARGDDAVVYGFRLKDAERYLKRIP